MRPKCFHSHPSLTPPQSIAPFVNRAVFNLCWRGNRNRSLHHQHPYFALSHWSWISVLLDCMTLRSGPPTPNNHVDARVPTQSCTWLYHGKAQPTVVWISEGLTLLSRLVVQSWAMTMGYNYGWEVHFRPSPVLSRLTRFWWYRCWTLCSFAISRSSLHNFFRPRLFSGYSHSLYHHYR